MSSQRTSHKYFTNPIRTRDSYIRTRVDEPDNPAILLTRSRRLTYRPRIRDTERLAKRQVGAIRPRLVPALDSSCDGVEDDGKVEYSRQFEPMGDFFADSCTIGFI
jgi:hypothetical protein